MVASSPLFLNWGATNLEIFHQAYASSKVLQPPSSSLPPFRQSSDASHQGKARSFPSGSELCRIWNNRCRTSVFTQCKCRHKCTSCHGQHPSLNYPSAATYRCSQSCFSSPPGVGGSPTRANFLPSIPSSFALSCSSVSSPYSSSFLQSAVRVPPLPVCTCPASSFSA